MSPLLLAALLLSPSISDEGHVRLVSDGTGREPVLWFLGGEQVATTTDGKSAEVNLSAGRHELWATTAFEGPWQVLARPDPSMTGVNFVPAWTAKFEPDEERSSAVPGWVLPASLAVLGFGLLLAPASKKP